MREEGNFYVTEEAGRGIFGRGRGGVWGRVGRPGPRRAAAGKMGLSYSKALKILHTAERGLAMPLVSTEAGGLGGRQHHHPPGQGSAGLVPAGPAGGGGDCPGSAAPPARGG